MNPRIKSSLPLAFAALMLALAVGAAPNLAAQSLTITNGNAIQGTWTVTVTQRNCQTGESMGAPFPSLLTFNQGGTLNESTANPSFYPALRLPGEGYWKSLPDGRYQASSIAFITSNGALAMTQRIDQMILLSGNNLASDARVYFYDPSGKLLRSGCATAVAMRYK